MIRVMMVVRAEPARFLVEILYLAFGRRASGPATNAGGGEHEPDGRR